MDFTTTIIFLAAVLALGVTAWAAFAKRRSAAMAVVTLAVAGLAGLLSWYSLIETHSLPWGVGYGATASVALAVAGRHLLPWGKESPP